MEPLGSSGCFEKINERIHPTKMLFREVRVDVLGKFLGF